VLFTISELGRGNNLGLSLVLPLPHTQHIKGLVHKSVASCIKRSVLVDCSTMENSKGEKEQTENSSIKPFTQQFLALLKRWFSHSTVNTIFFIILLFLVGILAAITFHEADNTRKRMEQSISILNISFQKRTTH